MNTPWPTTFRGPGEPVDACSVETEVAFDAADAAFAAGALSHHPREGARFSIWRRVAVGFPLVGNTTQRDSSGTQGVFNGGLAVAAVGSDRPRRSADAGSDPFDGGDEHGGIGRVAGLHGVVDDDPVIVAGPSPTTPPGRPRRRPEGLGWARALLEDRGPEVDLDNLDDMDDPEVEDLEEEVVDEATAARTPAELEVEIRTRRTPPGPGTWPSREVFAVLTGMGRRT